MSDRAEQLRGEGAVAGTGELVIDAESAREKLRKYRLPDPHMYVLQFVRAASALGASIVGFSIRVSTVECAFDVAIPGAILDEFWSIAFGECESPEEEAARHLALGIMAMQSLGPREITVESGGRRWTLTGDEERVVPSGSRPAVTRIVLSERFALSRVDDFFTRLFGDATESHILTRYCRNAPLSIEINGYPIRRRIKLPYRSTVGLGENFASIGLAVSDPGDPGSDPRSVYDVEWSRESDGPVVHVLSRDVEVSRLALDLHLHPARGWIEAPDLDTDLSGLSLLETDRNERLLRRLGYGAYHRSLAKWIAAHGTDRDRRRLLAQLARWASAVPASDRPAGTGELFDRLLGARLWQRADGPGRAPRVFVHWVTTSEHPEAPDLVIAHLSGGSQAVVPAGQLRHGDRVAFIEAGSVIPRAVQVELGLVGKLEGPLQNEVRVRRVRGVRSDGVCYPARKEWNEGDEVADELGIASANEEEGEIVSMTEVINAGELPYSSERIPGAELSDLGPVLLRPAFLPYETLQQIADVVDVELVDRREDLKVAHRRRVNIDRWRARPRRKESIARSYWCSSRVEVEGFVGVVYVPFDRTVEPAARVFVEGRLLCSRKLSPGVSFDVDGPFETNADFSGVDDPALGELAEGLVRKIPDVMKAFAARIAEDPSTHEARAAFFRQWLLADDDAHRVERALGVNVSSQRPRLSRELRVQTPCFEVYDGPPVSLETLRQWDSVPVLARDGHWREVLARMPEDAPPTVLAEPWHLDGYRELLGDRFRDAREVARREELRREFMERRRYVPPKKATLAETTVEFDDGTVGIRLLGASRSRVDTAFLHRNRVLTRRTFRGPAGAFRAVVRRDAVQPNFEYSDAASEEVVDRIRHEIVEAAGELLETWWRDTDPPDRHAVAELWFRAALWCLEHRRFPDDRPCFRLLDEHGISPASRREVRRVAEEAGHALQIANYRSGWSEELPTLWVPREVPPHIVVGLFPGITVAPVSISRDDAQRRYREFMERPQMNSIELPETVASFPVEGAFRGRAGLTRHGPGGRPGIELTVLVKGRVLEELEIPAPFGHFQVVLESDRWTPDPGYSMIVDGRSEMLEAARDAAGAVIEHLCRTYSGAGHSDALEALTGQLLRYLDVCDDEPPGSAFDVGDAIRAAPLLRTSDGTCTSLAMLAAMEEPIPYTLGDVDAPGILVVDDDRLDKLRRLLPDARFAPDLATLRPLGVPLLGRVARLLRAARGKRSDLIGDDMLASIRWTDDGADDLCAVSPEGVVVRRDADALADLDPDDPLGVAWLGSMIATEINRYYARISDADESSIQRRLMKL